MEVERERETEAGSFSIESMDIQEFSVSPAKDVEAEKTGVVSANSNGGEEDEIGKEEREASVVGESGEEAKDERTGDLDFKGETQENFYEKESGVSESDAFFDSQEVTDGRISSRDVNGIHVGEITDVHREEEGYVDAQEENDGSLGANDLNDVNYGEEISAQGDKVEKFHTQDEVIKGINAKDENEGNYGEEPRDAPAEEVVQYGSLDVGGTGEESFEHDNIAKSSEEDGGTEQQENPVEETNISSESVANVENAVVNDIKEDGNEVFVDSSTDYVAENEVLVETPVLDKVSVDGSQFSDDEKADGVDEPNGKFGGSLLSVERTASLPILTDSVEEKKSSEEDVRVEAAEVTLSASAIEHEGTSLLVPSDKSNEDEIETPVEDKALTDSVDPVFVYDDDDDDDDDDDYHNEGSDNNEVDEDERELVTETVISRNLEGKQKIIELEQGSSSKSTRSTTSMEYPHEIDGKVVLDTDEEEDDADGEENEELDSASLAALLKAVSNSSSDGNVTVTSQDGTRIFSINRPAGLGSSAPSLRPGPTRSLRENLFGSELAVAAVPEEEMSEEEKKLHEKVELIRVKFLRLVHRLGHSPDETVAAQVLYRLSLAEGIRRGRQSNRAFSIENAKKKALQLESDSKEDLNFSCNILVLGKTGVGKSATINSIFGEERSKISAFETTTTAVREIIGTVDGVKIRIIDTPGLRTSVMDQASNRKILSHVKKYTKKCHPDIVLYVDRMDTQTRDLNDLPLLRTITSTLGTSIWFNAIVALTHAASAPPEGPSGSPLTYEVFVAQRSHVVQQAIRQAAGDMRLMNPVALVENHPSCRKNKEGHKVLPNGLTWRPQMLLLCYSSKILSEANALLKLQDHSSGNPFGFRFRSPPLPFLLSSLLQSRTHPKLPTDQGGDNYDSDIDLDDFSDGEQGEEDEYDQLPPFKPLKRAQLAKLTKEQKKAYLDEYDYRVKLLQKKQWKDEIRRLKAMEGKTTQKNEQDYDNVAEEYGDDNTPATVPVPMPDMVLPPSFDCDAPTYRYRFLEPTSTLLARPVLDAHGWDHDCGYDGVNIEESLALASKFPAGVTVQVTKDKKEFSIHLDSSVSAKHGKNGSSLACFDIQTVGRQLAYVLRGETKFKNLRKNKTTGGISVTFLGDIVATGLKMEDQLSIGKRVALIASTGAVRAQGDTAYGANLEARLRDKDFPIGQALSTLGLSLMRWRGDLALGANLQSQFSAGRGSKIAVRLGLNNKQSGQITVKTSTSELLQIAFLGIIPIAASIYKTIRPSESFVY